MQVELEQERQAQTFPAAWISAARLFTGILRSERAGRLTMVLRLYADDSGSGRESQIFALAGYAGPIDIWDAFSDEWHAACLGGKPIKYLRTNEAIGLKEQFQQWTAGERDTKLVQLASVIANYRSKIVAVGATIEHALYRKFLTPIATKRAKDEPYYLLAASLCALCEHRLNAWAPPNAKIDFIFDSQGKVGTRFKRHFDLTLKPRYPLLGEFLQVSDIDYKPLQAADLCAWRERNDASPISMWTAADIYLRTIPRNIIPMEREWLRRFVRDFRP